MLDSTPDISHSTRHRWIRTALAVGGIYLVVTLASGARAGAAASDWARSVWRFAAFAICGMVLLAHAAYEHLWFGRGPRLTAWHASVAVAFGMFALAAVVNVRHLLSPAGYRPRMLIALVAWPLLIGVPAFVGTLVLTGLLSVIRRR